MIPRATRSTALPSAPGRTASSDASWARRTTCVGLLELGRQLPGDERPRAVRAVPVDAAAGVDDDRLPHLDPAVAGRRVGRGARLTCANGRGERRIVGAAFVHELCHPPDEIALRAADEALLGQPCERLGEDRGRAPHRRQLRAVLHLAQLLDEPAASHELDPAGRKRLVPRVRERLCLETDASLEALRQVAVEVAARLHRLDAANRPGAVRVPEVREQPNAVALDEQCGIRAVETAEVADVHRARDEERLLDRRLQPLDSILHGRAPSARYSSASR